MLQKDTISLNIANSLDQKTDDKLIQPDKLAGVRNRRFKKIGTLDKRPGQLQQTTAVITDYANPLALGAGDGKSSIQPFQDQLTLDNKGVFYSKRTSATGWQFVNHSSSVNVDAKDVASPALNSLNCDSLVIGTKTLIASTTSSKLYYSLIETETGIYLANSVEVGTGTVAKCLTVGGNAFIIYIDGTSLKRVTINLSTGAAGTPSTLKSDVISNLGTLDVLNMPSTAAGDVGVCAYRRSGDANIFLIDSAGAAIGTPAPVNTGESPADGIALYYNASISQNRVYIAYCFGLNIRTAAFTIGAGSITTLYGPSTASAASITYDSLAMALDPISGNLIVFLDSINRTYGAPGTASRDTYMIYPNEARIDYCEIQTGGTAVTSATNYAFGLRLAAKPIVDLTRSTILVPAIADSYTQATLHLADFNRGKAPRTFFSQAKWFYGKAQARRNRRSTSIPTGTLPAVSALTATSYSFCGLKRIQVTGFSTDSLVGQISRPEFKIGLALHTVDLSTDAARSSATFSKSLVVSGGHLQQFDGDTFSEQGFLVDPETLWASASNSPVKTTFTDGTGSTPAVLRVQMGTGAAFNFFANASSKYITFDTPSTDYYLWFEVDGAGVDPALASRTGIKVTVSSYYSPGEITQTTTFPVGPINISYASTVYELDTIVITNTANGSVTAPTTTGLTYSLTSTVLSTGSYQYTAVWKWVDAQGLTHRSAPATPVTVECPTSSNAIGSVNVIVPPLSNREISQLEVEIYRTAANGETFYLINNTAAGTFTVGNVPWPTTRTRIYFVDGVPDSTLTRGEILYTTGDVLPNYGVGQARHICAHQKRLVVSTEDPTQLLFSKTRSEGVPVEFAIENEIRVNNEDSPIRGHASLDDKLVIFKDQYIYIVAGQYPNDLGTQGTLSEPQAIASDTGCESHASIVLFPDGLIFKSQKGFYRLSRSLQVDYIGKAVEDYNDYTVSAGVLDTLNNEISFYHSDTQDRLVYNYLLDRWAIWDNQLADCACVYENEIYRVTNAAVVHKQTESEFKDITLDGGGSQVVAYFTSEIELPWLKVKGLQDFQRITYVSLIGTYKSAHTVQATLYYDYDLTNYSIYAADSEEIKTGVYQWKIKPEIQKCEAIKIKYVETPDSAVVGNTGESVKLTDVSLDVGLKRGLYKTTLAKRG